MEGEELEKNTLYQLTDLYSLFYLIFKKQADSDDEYFWLNANDTPIYRSWNGYAFEMICLHHISQIKQTLGIIGVQTSVASWYHKDAQIDLIIDRKDQVINLCEMKFSINAYAITKSYDDKLRDKIGVFKAATKTKKSVFLTMITTYGLAKNKHSYLAQNDLSMNILFKPNFNK